MDTSRMNCSDVKFSLFHVKASGGTLDLGRVENKR